MNGMLLFFGSFFLVFALGFQQSNVQHSRYQAAFVNGLFIGVMNLLVLRMGPSASNMEMIAFLIGGALGSAAAIWFNGRIFIRTNKPNNSECFKLSPHWQSWRDY
jgi:uncharacterized membrane-anchored protein YitT (DUF2179 family)